MSMTLAEAVRLVIDDTVEQNGAELTDREAVALARTIDMDDVHGSRSPDDDPRLLPAYALFLAATDGAIEFELGILGGA